MLMDLPEGGYKVLVADPPWRFQAWSHRGEGKGASQHYPCMSLDDICALPVASIAAPDAALFLWVVQPMLPEALRVLESWSFSFRTVAFCWVKMRKGWDGKTHERPRLGLGYHTRSGMEQCWLAIRGKGYKRKAQGIEQVVFAPLREHSRKPDEVMRRIDALVGDVPKVELFAREARGGWATWGLETNKFLRSETGGNRTESTTAGEALCCGRWGNTVEPCHTGCTCRLEVCCKNH